MKNKNEKDFAPSSQEFLSNQFHQIIYISFEFINFILSISSNKFNQINLIKSISSIQSNFISSLSISFYQFDFINFILYALELISSKYSKILHSVDDEDPPFS